MALKNMFYNKLKTYKAGKLHPDCEVVKKKKFDMAIKEIEKLLKSCRGDVRMVYEYHLKNLIERLKD